jgi:hypothetical protein
MQSQHHPYDIRTFTKGANRDIEKELLYLEDGAYVDACNFRVVSMGGDYAAAKKINGEELLYPNIDNRCNVGTGLPLTTSYECIGAAEINDHIIEFWADAAGVEPSLIRIDGQIVLYSVDFPIQVMFPLQIAKNESCIGGEIYTTDFNVPPMIFNIEDLMSNSGMLPDTTCTDKYFDGFNINDHQLQVTNPIDHPIFIKLTSSGAGFNKIFGSGGLPDGYYSYQTRYSTQAGDKTIWSVPTPLIPVVSRLTSGCSPTFPYMQTHSKDPDTSSPSVYGIHLKFRVNNINNFDFIEVRRNSYYSGDPLGVAPVSELVGFVDIANGDVGVVNVLDNGPQAEETLSPDEAAEAMNAINKAKAIRYFNNKLYLMNIEYASRDVEQLITFVDATPTGMFPILEKIYKSGLKDVWKYTYNKPYMDGEKYGMSVLMYDDNNQFSYAIPIPNFTNFKMPNRRDVPGTDTVNHSYFGMPEAARVDGTVGNSHEIFDLEDAVAKSDACSFLNIMDLPLEGKSAGFDNYNENQFGCNAHGFGGTADAHEIGYKPLTPTGQNDSRCAGTDYVINTWIRNVSVGSKIKYNPEGFAPNYYSMGMAFKGLATYPDWVKAFSVVRTPPAKRVVAQGIGYYSLNAAGGAFGSNLTKNLSEFWFYSPDTDAGTSLDPQVVDDIIANPSNYEIELVSPLGFFTEVYSANIEAGSDKGADLITYARILKENSSNPEMNPEEDPTRGLVSGAFSFTSYGAWRYAATDAGNTVFPNGVATGNTTRNIVNASEIQDNRAGYLKFLLNSAVYNSFGTGGPVNGDDPAVRKWHEPLYIVNIVRKSADIADSNVQQYIHTGHLQKIESLIGLSDGSNGQVFELVDERWEDCMPSINGMVTNPYSGLFRFIHIDNGDGVKKRWINVSNLTGAQLTAIYTQLTASGQASVTDTSGTYIVYGVYSQSQSSDATAPIYKIIFQQLTGTVSAIYFNPIADAKIYVLYDNRIPIRFFGGDVSQAEATCAFLDKQYDKNANPNGSQNEFKFNLGFPNSIYNINDRYFIVNRTTGANKIQNDNSFYFDKNFSSSPSRVRQLLCMFACRSRADITYSFNDESTKHSSDQYFTLKNYVIRPYRWDDGEFGNTAADVYSDNNMWAEYEDDYGDEFLLWGYGGFRFIHNVNIDFSKDLNDGINITSVPQVGFEEETHFCTRVIWSLSRPINSQNSPGVRTFLSQNSRDISDDTGEIKYAYDALTEKSNNLYAFTQDGCCLLLVDKRLVHEISGDELATVGTETSGVLGEIWITKEIGMNDEFWRSAGEFSNTLYFGNKKSVYIMQDNAIGDIAKTKYYSKLYPDFLRDFPAGYEGKLTGVYNLENNEYWISFGKRDPSLIPGSGFDGEVIEWCMLDQNYNLTNIAYNPNNIPFDDTCLTTNLGLNENQVLNIHTETFSGVVLGGPSATTLDHPVRICVDPSSTGSVSVVYYLNSVQTGVLILEPGECACFLPTQIGSTNQYSWAVGTGCAAAEFEDYDCPTQAYAENNKYWNGSFDYKFDRYVRIDNRLFGMRGLETYELNKGFRINGAPIMGVLLGCSSNPPFADKEFVRMRVNSNVKPVAAQFFNTIEQALTDDVQCELNVNTNPLHFKNYNGYEQYIPRKTLAPKHRMQGRILFYKIIHNLEEDFRIVDVGIQYKKLK